MSDTKHKPFASSDFLEAVHTSEEHLGALARRRRTETQKSTRVLRRDSENQASRNWSQANPAKKMLATVRQRDPSCTLTEAWIQERLDDGICEVTGIYLSSPLEKGPFAPSIDRIDSSKGYKPWNCRVVCLTYNYAKHTWGDEDVLTMAQAFVRRSGL